MIGTEYARIMARYSRWMNERLYECCARLTEEQRKEDVGAFFKSIHGTLNHLLLADVNSIGLSGKEAEKLLDDVGMEPGLTLVLFTLDESSYSRELAPLAGVYPSLRLGPPWWFHDSPEGMRRFRELATETAGFYNTVGFNDDTRAFPSIPARHDVARRVDCAFLARLVTEHRLGEDEAHEVAHDLAYALAKRAYRL